MRRTSITLLAGAAALPLIALAVAGCGGSSSAKPTAASGPPKTALGQTATVGAQNDGNLGTILVDSLGRTLYLFSGDQKSGDTNGQGSTAFGGGWYALSGAGNQITAQASSNSMSSSSSGGGYGY